MRVIKLDEVKMERITAVVYGASRSGKTEYGGTWPRPIFLADATEGGWDTLAHMDRSKLWEPELWPKYPEVREIADAADMLQQVAALEARCQERPGEIKTIVIDTISSYADMYLSRLEAAERRGADGKVNSWEKYMNLFQHLRTLVRRIHGIPDVNVLWLGHAKAPNDVDSRGGLAIPGKMGEKLPALAKCWFYQQVVRRSKKLTYELRTQWYGNWPAGHRFGGLLPDPLEPTYRALLAALEGRAPVVAPAATEAAETETGDEDAGGGTGTSQISSGNGQVARLLIERARAAAASRVSGKKPPSRHNDNGETIQTPETENKQKTKR